MALALFDFCIVHRPGQDHVVPDFLSRNPIDKYPEFDNYVLPPVEVANFFPLALRLIYIIMKSLQLNDTLGGLSCLYLSTFEAENHSNHVYYEKVKNSVKSFTANSKPNTKFNKEKSHIKTNGTSDFNCLKEI